MVCTTSDCAERGNKGIKCWNRLLGPAPTNPSVVAHTFKFATMKSGLVDLATELDYTGERARFDPAPSRASSSSSEASLNDARKNSKSEASASVESNDSEAPTTPTPTPTPSLDAYLLSRHGVSVVDVRGDGACLWRAYLRTVFGRPATPFEVGNLIAATRRWLRENMEMWEEGLWQEGADLRQRQEMFLAALDVLQRDHRAGWEMLIDQDFDMDPMVIALSQISGHVIVTHSQWEATGTAAAATFSPFMHATQTVQPTVRLVQTAEGRNFHFMGTFRDQDPRPLMSPSQLAHLQAHMRVREPASLVANDPPPAPPAHAVGRVHEHDPHVADEPSPAIPGPAMGRPSASPTFAPPARVSADRVRPRRQATSTAARQAHMDRSVRGLGTRPTPAPSPAPSSDESDEEWMRQNSRPEVRFLSCMRRNKQP
jgi:hypothetical protein